jgi:hypothetical protein
LLKGRMMNQPGVPARKRRKIFVNWKAKVRGVTHQVVNDISEDPSEVTTTHDRNVTQNLLME